jgi:phosphatidate cytidylyltransferase
MNDPSPSPKQDAKGFGARVGSDLGPRVVSGVVLAAIALSAIWFGREPLAVLLAIVGGIVAWEWGRIVRGAQFDAATVAHVATVIAGIVLTGFGWAGPAIIGVLIGTILTALLAFGRHSTLSAVGVLFAGLPGIALLWLRSDEPLGAAAVYFIVAAVAATDIAAYFCGRLIGGAKLWPRVSPKKTWSGLIGGVSAAASIGFITAHLVPGAHAVHLTIMGGALAVVAQGGDLAESALKRHFGAKDASQLIPGHGGFMDRVDGLATVAVVAAAWAASFGMSTPARALLTW